MHYQPLLRMMNTPVIQDNSSFRHRTKYFTKQIKSSYDGRSLSREVKNFSKISLLSSKSKTKEKQELRVQNPDKNKNISTTDAKALRPEMLDTSVPSMQMKDWYRKWDNY